MQPKPPRSQPDPGKLEDALRQRDQFQAEAQNEFERARSAHFPERRRGDRRSGLSTPVAIERRRGNRRAH